LLIRRILNEPFNDEYEGLLYLALSIVRGMYDTHDILEDICTGSIIDAVLFYWRVNHYLIFILGVMGMFGGFSHATATFEY
jgi:hypothetical protein